MQTLVKQANNGKSQHREIQMQSNTKDYKIRPIQSSLSCDTQLALFLHLFFQIDTKWHSKNNTVIQTGSGGTSL